MEPSVFLRTLEEPFFPHTHDSALHNGSFLEPVFLSRCEVFGENPLKGS